MEYRRKIISLILATILIVSFTIFAFAEDGSDESDLSTENKVSATINNGEIDGTNNKCFWAGTVTLTNPSGRNLILDGENIAYHVVDELGFTLYLQRKPTTNGVVSTVATYSYDKEDDDYAFRAFAKTVTKSGYYRVSGIFSTEHTGHGVEGGSTATNWMWID